MNVKALQKQLMAAVAMVIVAAIAMSSATYAWFVNNAQVTATNVSVQAATAYSLLISHTNDTNAAWGTTTALTKKLTTLTPVSTVGEIMTTQGGLKLTKAKTSAENSNQGDVPAVGIADDTTVAVGDVRFVTNTKWESNYVTGVSEVSASSTTGSVTDSTSNTYFYKETVYLKAAQAGDVYLDSTGLGINWAMWDAENKKVSETTTLKTFKDFCDLPQISLDGLDETQKKAAETYNADLASAQALLKTLRIGLLVSQTVNTSTTRTWHEYQLVTGNFTTHANTTGSSSSGAEGITIGVSAVDGKKNSATNTVPVVASISNAKTMSGKTMADYAIPASPRSRPRLM
jgi:hypothetical protein